MLRALRRGTQPHSSTPIALSTRLGGDWQHRNHVWGPSKRYRAAFHYPNCPFDVARSWLVVPKSCLGSFERGLQWSWGAAGQEPGHLLARGQAQFPSITRSKDGRTPPRHQASHSPPKAQVGLPTRLRVPHSLTRIPGIPSSAQSPSQPPKARINCRRLEPTAQGPNQLPRARAREAKNPGIFTIPGFIPRRRGDSNP